TARTPCTAKPDWTSGDVEGLGAGAELAEGEGEAGCLAWLQLGARSRSSAAGMRVCAQRGGTVESIGADFAHIQETGASPGGRGVSWPGQVGGPRTCTPGGSCRLAAA